MTGKFYIFLILAIFPVYECKPKRKIHMTFWPRNTTPYTGPTAPFLKLTMEYLMEQKKVVPNVFPAGPRDSMFVKFPIHYVRGRPGQILSHEDCQKAPYMYYNGLALAHYSVVMVLAEFDMKANQTSYYNEWVHWILVNVPGRKLRSGKRIVPYNVPLQPYSNGTAYYMVFLAYRQRWKFNETELETIKPTVNDGSFRIHKWCWDLKMRYPDAGFFFTLRYDVYANRSTTVTTPSTTTEKVKKDRRRRKNRRN
ncbi:putative odorant-binding protein A5 [Planococcus citri]|uniref:putative odorant-binding protein A5 n=1 Tax=Planococcus citri TaxID=170843 RepID=UPI0031F82206